MMLSLRPVGRLIGILCISLSSTLASANDQPGTVLIEDVTVFDGKGTPPFRANVLIEDGKITALGGDLSASGSTPVVIDGAGQSLLPGLIDIHTHWTTDESQSRVDIAATLLRHGVTTVADYHSMPESFAPKRKYHQQFPSPDIFYVARMSTPGGHGADWADENTTRTVVAEYDAARTVHALAASNPDVIKIFADGWRYGSGHDNTSISEPALTALVEEAHKVNLPVFAHIVTVSRAKIGTRAGVDAIVHAIQDADADDELVELLRAADTFYAPTLAVYEPRPDKLAAIDDPIALERIQTRQAHSKYNLQMLLTHDVPIALGTDSGIASTPFGESTLRELELLVDFGVSPQEALIAGTANSAAALRLDDRGTIEPGKRADLLLIDGQPWIDIGSIRNISAVFVEGTLVVQDGVMVDRRTSPSRVRQPSSEMIDDFEVEELTGYGGRRLKSSDTGYPRSQIIFQQARKADGSHYLQVAAELAVKPEPYSFVTLPLSRGMFNAVDASRFSGISFRLKADGPTEIRVQTPHDTFSHILVGTTGWQTYSVPFDNFKSTGEGQMLAEPILEAISFGREGSPGEHFWFDIDDVRFF